MPDPIITHAFVSGKAQGADPHRVYGNHWDADHVLTGLDEWLASQIEHVGFPSIGDAAASSPDIGTIKYIRTDSYAVGSGYGGGVYHYVASAPAHLLYFTTANGHIFELLPTCGKVFPTQAGAIPDGVEGVFTGATDNQTALTNAYAYSIAKNVQLYFETPGVYNHSATWALGDATGNLIPNIDFVGPDKNVVIQHTGTGINVSLDAGAVALPKGGLIGLTGRPLFTGNPLTTKNFYHRGYQGIYVGIFSGDALTVGAEFSFTVSSVIDFISSTNFRPVYGTKPATALSFVDRGGGETSTNTNVKIKIEGMLGGMQTNGLQGAKISGTSEGNTWGYLGSALSANNTFENLHCEANSSFDISLNGEFNSTLENCVCVSAVASSLAINGPANKIKGGTFYSILMLAGAVRTSFDGAGYQNTFDDTLGTGTSWKDLYSINTGTGVRTPIADRLSYQGDTGTGALVHKTNAALVTPDLGTPSAAILTNATGTAASLTAGHVTTNANLTGDVTSVGNATTFATVNSNVGTFGSATQAAQVTVNAKGLATAAANVTVTPAVGSITGLGTGVGTALAINVGSAGAPVTFNGAGGTPSSIVLTNATGTAASLTAGTASAVAVGGITGLGTNVAAALANTLNAASGLVGFSGTLGAPTATSINKVAFTAPATAATLTILNNKTATFNNSITFAGTDGTIITFPSTNATVARTDTGQTFTGTNAFGVITATTLNGNTFTTGTYTLTGAAGKTFTFSNTITLAGTDGTTMTFPGTNATIARTDAANTFTGIQTFGTAISIGSGGTGDTGTAWTASTPTPTANNGHTFTSVSGTLRYKTIGKTVVFQGTLTATTLGTVVATDYAFIALPVNAAVVGTSFSAANGTTQGTVTGLINFISSQTFAIRMTGLAAGDVFYFAGSYESA